MDKGNEPCLDSSFSIIFVNYNYYWPRVKNE